MKYYTWNPNLLTTNTQTTDRMIFTNQSHDKQTRGTAFRNAAQVRSKKKKKKKGLNNHIIRPSLLSYLSFIHEEMRFGF